MIESFQDYYEAKDIDCEVNCLVNLDLLVYDLSILRNTLAVKGSTLSIKNGRIKRWHV